MNDNRLVANAILLPQPPSQFLRPLTLADGLEVATWDVSFFPFLVEDLVAHSAAEIAIHPRSIYYGAKDDLPRVFRDRLREVDVQGVALEKAHAVLAPVFKELSLEPFGGIAAYQPVRGSRPEHLELVRVTEMLELFLIGFDNRVQVTVDPTEVRTLLEGLRRNVSNSDSRASLASTEGLFRTYSRVDAASVRFRSEAEADMVEVFARFVEDETYRTMAREAGLLGIPARITHALIRLRRAAADLVARPTFADIVKLGEQTIAVATQTPSPEPGLIARILAKSRYMPPLLGVDEATDRSLGAWRAAAPSFRPLPGLLSEYGLAHPQDDG